MAPPATFLKAIEEHRCFSGTFARGYDIATVVDPALPPFSVFSVNCRDCLTWYAGVARSALPAKTTLDALATEATRHSSAVRGYDDALGGYHAGGGGFWLSAVYIRSLQAFLIDGRRSRAMGSDLDLLLQAFKLGVMKMPDPGMVDPSRYVAQSVHLDMSQWRGPFTSLGAFLASPAVHARGTSNTSSVTLATFQSAVTAVAPVTPAVPAVTATAPQGPNQRTEGTTCPACGEVVRWRPLLTSHYLGCGCD